MREGIKHETCVRTFNAEKRRARVNLKASDGTRPKIVLPPPSRATPQFPHPIFNFPTRNTDQNPRKRWTKTTRSPSQSVVWGAPKRAPAKNDTTRQSVFRLRVDRVGRGAKRAPPHADRPGVQWKHGRNFGGRFSRSLDPRLFRPRRWLRLSRWRGRSSAGSRWYRGRRGSGPGPVNFHHPPAGIAASLWLVIPAGFAARRRGVSLRSFLLHGEGGGKWCRIRELAVENGGRIAPAGRFRRDIFPAGIFFGHVETGPFFRFAGHVTEDEGRVAEILIRQTAEVGIVERFHFDRGTGTVRYIRQGTAAVDVFHFPRGVSGSLWVCGL